MHYEILLRAEVRPEGAVRTGSFPYRSRVDPAPTDALACEATPVAEEGRRAMTCFICRTCAVQYADSRQPPPRCPICEDERQYVGWQGQLWTTMEELSAEGFRSEVRELEPGLAGIGTTPTLAIGQRALLVQTEAGNVLWDCSGYLDQAGIERVRELGGLAGISASH